MVAVSMIPAATYDDQYKQTRLKEIQGLCAVQTDFEQAYAGLNEKYINEIIDQESQKRAGPCCPTCGRNDLPNLNRN